MHSETGLFPIRLYAPSLLHAPKLKRTIIMTKGIDFFILSSSFALQCREIQNATADKSPVAVHLNNEPAAQFIHDNAEDFCSFIFSFVRRVEAV